MKLGPYSIPEGAFLAPMAGITNPPFRRLCKEMGAALTVTELISAHALVLLRRNPALKDRSLGASALSILEPFAGEHPFAVQIFGRDPGLMAEAALFVVEQGAHIVDLNFGCPARKVVKNGLGAGAALMREPDLLQEIARRVVNTVSVPVTAKIRLGWSPSQENAPQVAAALEEAGVQAVTVHARTRDQVHSGPVDLDALAAVCEGVKIPVIGNGGISGRGDASRMRRQTGCERVAIGQAARGNPWIFGEILGNEREPSLAERVEACRRHLALYTEWAGERRAALEMRKHAAWYLKGFKGAAHMRRRLNEAVDLESYDRLLDEIG